MLMRLNYDEDFYLPESSRTDTVDGRVFAPPGWLVHPAKECNMSSSGHVFRIYLIQFSYRVSQTPTKNERDVAFGGGGLRPPPPHFGDPFIFGRGL